MDQLWQVSYDSATIAQLLDPYAEDFDSHQLHAELRMVHVVVKQTGVAVTTFTDLILYQHKLNECRRFRSQKLN